MIIKYIMIYDTRALSLILSILGITQLPKGSEKYNAATNLIGVGIDFDSCSAGPAGTILKLQDVPKRNPKYHLPNEDWVKSTRLDSQGDIISNKHK